MFLNTVTTVYCAAVHCTEHQSSAGDFHQLPPVAKGKEAAAARKFAFEAATWQQCVHHCAQLTKVFRQVSPSRLHFQFIPDSLGHGASCNSSDILA